MQFFVLFLSTLSLRRATPKYHRMLLRRNAFLSTLSLRRATRNGQNIKRRHKFLSTLSLRRATASFTLIFCPPRLFLSTLSLRRATCWCWECQLRYQISIHALLAESDRVVEPGFANKLNFYPRSPCGERRRFRFINNTEINISIHALLAESDYE